VGAFFKNMLLCCTSANYQQRTVKTNRKIQNKTNDGKYFNRQLFEKYILAEMFSGSLVINALEKDPNFRRQNLNSYCEKV
jgi:hypothetical protein